MKISYIVSKLDTNGNAENRCFPKNKIGHSKALEWVNNAHWHRITCKGKIVSTSYSLATT